MGTALENQNKKITEQLYDNQSFINKPINKELSILRT